MGIGTNTDTQEATRLSRTAAADIGKTKAELKKTKAELAKMKDDMAEEAEMWEKVNDKAMKVYIDERDKAKEELAKSKKMMTTSGVQTLPPNRSDTFTNTDPQQASPATQEATRLARELAADIGKTKAELKKTKAELAKSKRMMTTSGVQTLPPPNMSTFTNTEPPPNRSDTFTNTEPPPNRSDTFTNTEPPPNRSDTFTNTEPPPNRSDTFTNTEPPPNMDTGSNTDPQQASPAVQEALLLARGLAAGIEKTKADLQGTKAQLSESQDNLRKAMDELAQSNAKESFKEKKVRVMMEREEQEAEQLKEAKEQDAGYGGTARQLSIRQKIIAQNEKMFNRSMEDRSAAETAQEKKTSAEDEIAQETKTVATSFSRPLAMAFAANRSFQERLAPQKRMDSGAEQRPTIDDTLSRPRPWDAVRPLPTNLRWDRPSLDVVSQDTADIPRQRPSAPRRSVSIAAPKPKPLKGVPKPTRKPLPKDEI
jgi:hypothetical protein